MGEGESFHFTLKKYVSNAIALGPSSSNVIYSDEGETLPQRMDANSEDAPYEVIEPRHTKGRGGRRKQ